MELLNMLLFVEVQVLDMSVWFIAFMCYLSVCNDGMV